MFECCGGGDLCYPDCETLSPAVTRAAEAVEAQDPMLRCPTFGELASPLVYFEPRHDLPYADPKELVERIAKGGGE